MNRISLKRSLNLVTLWHHLIPIVLLQISHTLFAQTMTKNMREDVVTLSKLNAQFIKNYLTQDTASHNQLIHKDFVCIQNSGGIVSRDEYMKDWAQSYQKGGFTSFTYAEENIRLFGNTALVRSKTIYIKVKDRITTKGRSIYTDTYVKENGRWWCVQAQITPIK